MRASVGQWTLVAMMLAAMTGCQSGSSGLAWNKWRFGKGNDETAIASKGPSVDAPALPSQGATPTSVGPYSNGTQVASATYGVTPPGASYTPGAYPQTQGGYTLPGATPYNPAQPSTNYAATTPGTMSPQAGYYNPNYGQAVNSSATYPEAQVAGGYTGGGYTAPTSATAPTTSYPNAGTPQTADNRYSSSPSTTDRYPSTGGMLAAPSSYQPPTMADYNAGQTGYQPGAMTDNPVGGSSYQPGTSSYTPGQSSYQPGQTSYAPANTGYQAPAQQYQTPTTGYQPPSGNYLPPSDAAPYRPGNTSDYVPSASGAQYTPATSDGSAVRYANHETTESTDVAMPAVFVPPATEAATPTLGR